MKLHEFQAKELFAKQGLKTPVGYPAFTPEEVQQAVDKLKADKVVLKSQVHVGGRGKAGGIKVVASADAVATARELFAKDIKGLPIRKLLVESALNIGKEYYLGMTLDRATRKTVVMASSMGGVDIEEVAKEHPDKIIKVWIDPEVGLTEFQIRQIIFNAEFPAASAPFIKGLYDVYLKYDCSIAEINPLVLTGEGEVVAADGKIDIDDNALFRHGAEVDAYHDPAESDPNELAAKAAGLSYVELDGDIGCVVNGAGLAMATMDAIKYGGGQPANFLDIGGSSNPNKVKVAMEILKNRKVKGILFNIFGGITRCDDVARGLISALEDMGGLEIPLVIRLTGTNEDIAKQLLTEKGYKAGSSMTEAVREIIAASSKN